MTTSEFMKLKSNGKAASAARLLRSMTVGARAISLPKYGLATPKLNKLMGIKKVVDASPCVSELLDMGFSPSTITELTR